MHTFYLNNFPLGKGRPPNGIYQWKQPVLNMQDVLYLDFIVYFYVPLEQFGGASQPAGVRGGKTLHEGAVLLASLLLICTFMVLS